MNPLVKYGIAVAFNLGLLAAGYMHGIEVQKGRQAAAELAMQETRDAAMQGAAEAISKIKVTNTTIRGEVQREIQTNTVYRDCKLPADGLRIANEAISGTTARPAGSGKLPSANAAGE